MTDTIDQLEKAKSLIKNLYNSANDDRLKKPLLKAYKRLEEGADVSDLTARAASAVNYLRITYKLTFTPQQEKSWRELRGMGSAAIMYHDSKNNLLDLSEM